MKEAWLLNLSVLVKEAELISALGKVSVGKSEGGVAFCQLSEERKKKRSGPCIRLSKVGGAYV